MSERTRGAKMMQRVDGYVRVSRVGDRELHSDRLQREAIEREAERLGLRLGEVIVDLDQSGGREDRPGLVTAMERIEAGYSSGIMVTRLDRFSRDIGQALRLAARIDEAGGTLWVIEEPADFKTADGALMVQLRLAIATHQRKLANAYFEKAKADATQRGVPITPRLAPGVMALRDDAGRRVGVALDPEVAPVIREVFERRVAGAGPAELAQILEAAGVHTSMGSASWSKPAIYGLLRHRIYLGELRQGEHVNRCALEPLIDRATWEAAQPGRAVVRPAAASPSSPYVLAGVARCAACGYCMQGTTHSRGWRLYRCTVRHASGPCPEPARIRAEEVEQLVMARVRELADDQPHAPEVGPADEIAALEIELERAERERDRWATDVTIREAFGEEAWLAGARERKTQVDRALDAVAEKRAAAPSEPVALHYLADELERMANADLRAALGAALDCVAIRSARHEDRIHVYLRGAGPRDLPRRGYRANAQPRLYPFAELAPAAAVDAA